MLKISERLAVCRINSRMKGESNHHRQNGGWTIKSTRNVFENDFFAVFEDDVIKPNGEDGKYATIRFNPGVSVLPIDADDNLYLTRQFRYAIGRHDIEIVAGSIEGEGALDGAKRELKEELGIDASDWIDVGISFAITSIGQCSSRQFIARGLTFGKQETEGTEQIESCKIPLTDAIDMVIRGEITDGDTCILIMKAALLKEKTAAGPSEPAANLCEQKE
jgi:8-oxo-dGTP pyrophosphatase MutT (NUDIX family)